MFEHFQNRHVGISEADKKQMLSEIGVNSINELIDKVIPSHIRLQDAMKLEPAIPEHKMFEKFKSLGSKNKIFDSYIGLGFHPTLMPAVIQRNILENASWYTSYTPYQAEISQGRLEALLNFQTVITDLTRMEIANASLLDEATAASEAILMLASSKKKEKKESNKVFVDENIFPFTKDVLLSRLFPRNIKVEFGKIDDFDYSNEYFSILVQNPNNDGELRDFSEIFAKSAENGIRTAVIVDLLSIALVKSPGEMGADVVVGNSQRFGQPMGFGGPHAAFFATKEEFKRNIPGRIIGVSVDSKGKKALRMALQTREQHIKREKATSNICTAQALLAIIAGMYAVYHGADGIKNIASRVNYFASVLTYNLKSLNLKQTNNFYFDTIQVEVSEDKKSELKSIAEKHYANFRFDQINKVGISINEITNEKAVLIIINIFEDFLGIKNSTKLQSRSENSSIPNNLKRTTEYLKHEIFTKYHSETEMMRYIKKLERKDISLTHSMISLGSCTMKLNAAIELFPLSWAEFGNVHPFAPNNQVEGYSELISDLGKDLCEITGFTDISFQPNSGAQGELTGLLTMMAFHHKNNQANRNVILIPSSAHGTNPASAIMAGAEVIVVKCDENGNVDVLDLKQKADENKDNLAGLMITYPSTHGIFETKIIEIIDTIHENGGLVYMDGANMNAQVGLTSPARIGADVCHLNLHKTFAIPHGGGGPGAGPILVNDKLKQFLPNHFGKNDNRENGIYGTVAAQFGSAFILTISYAYIKMMGEEGLRNATESAILNANYLRAKLSNDIKVLYTGETGFVGHELIFDFHSFKSTANIEVEDVAKRLIDYGFHAPTVSFPVHSTLMVEPTESESKAELDRFIETLRNIKNEIDNIENGKWSKLDNPLKNAPHTAEDISVEIWSHTYTREQAVYPLNWIKDNKFWVSVNRIDNAYGDRNLFCSCVPTEEFTLEEN